VLILWGLLDRLSVSRKFCFPVYGTHVAASAADICGHSRIGGGTSKEQTEQPGRW